MDLLHLFRVAPVDCLEENGQTVRQCLVVVATDHQNVLVVVCVLMSVERVGIEQNLQSREVVCFRCCVPVLLLKELLLLLLLLVLLLLLTC